jgi:hypothetical protein
MSMMTQVVSLLMTLEGLGNFRLNLGNFVIVSLLIFDYYFTAI